MTNLRIHLVYLAIIGFLVFQYWAKSQALEAAVGSIEQFDKLLKADDMVASHGLKMELYTYEKIFKAYPSEFMNSISKRIKYSTTTIDKISEWLEKQRNDFIQIAGGFDHILNGYHPPSKYPTNYSSNHSPPVWSYSK